MRESVLAADPSAELAAIVVWSPVVKSDDLAAAERLAAELDDPRATLLWDPDQAVGKALQAKLAIGDAPLAWDVYCFYGREATWDDAMPEPEHWAHQLAGADPEHFFGRRLGQVLRGWTEALTEGRAPDPAAPEPVGEGGILIRSQDLRPLPEILLEQILDELRRDVAAGKARIDVPPEQLEALGAELRRRMAAATEPHAGQVPKAVRHAGQVLVVPASDCAPPRKTDR